MIDTKKNHHTVSFISLIFNILFFLGLIMFANFIKKNINTWISTIEKKVEQKVDAKTEEIKREIPGIIGETLGLSPG